MRSAAAVVWATTFACAAGILGIYSAWWAALCITLAVGGWFAILGLPAQERDE